MIRLASLRVRRLDATLADDEGGQIAALGVLGAAVFASLLMLVIATGYSTNGKIELQNAADATAVSGATWVARGLNVVSMNNVTSTQILSIIVVVRALQTGVPAAIKVLEAQEKLLAVIPYVGPALAAAVRAQIVTLQVVEGAVSAARPLVQDRGVLWQVLSALEGISEFVTRTFGTIAMLEGNRVARQNGADAGLVLSQTLLVAGLPLKAGNFQPDFCAPMREKLSDYDRTLNLVFIAWANSGIHGLYWAFKESSFVSLCGASTGSPEPGGTATLEACRRLGGTAYWGEVKYESRWLPSPASPFRPTGSGDPRLASGPTATAQPIPRPCNAPAPGRVERSFQRTVGGRTEYRYEVVEYEFMSARLRDAEGSGPPPPLPAGHTPPGRPRPYLLVDNAEAELRYLAVVYRGVAYSLPRDFQSVHRGHRLAYGQVKVYNPTAVDTFTQDWRVTLTPATLVEELPGIGSPAGLSGLSGILDAGPLLDGGLLGDLGKQLNLLRGVNNH